MNRYRCAQTHNAWPRSYQVVSYNVLASASTHVVLLPFLQNCIFCLAGLHARWSRARNGPGWSDPKSRIRPYGQYAKSHAHIISRTVAILSAPP